MISAMKQIFLLFRRTGIFYARDSRTGAQKSLKTQDKGDTDNSYSSTP
jgi:hypothetical protein